MSARGSFRVQRDVFDLPVLSGEPFDRRAAWLWLLSEAAWDNRIVERAGRSIKLMRGQLVHSLRFIADQWKWEYKRVDRFLEKLRNHGMIRLQSDMGGTVVTVIDYDRLQGEKAGQQRDSNGTVSGTMNGTGNGTDGNFKNTGTAAVCTIDDKEGGTENGTGNAPPSGGRVSEIRDKTNKQINKRKTIFAPKSRLVRDDWPANGFEVWYASYPRKTARYRAEKAFCKVRDSGEVTFDELIARTEHFAAEPRDPKYIPYPSTWLNDGRYLECDTPTAPAETSGVAEPQRDPNTFITQEWATRLIDYFKHGQWPEPYWGPAPDKPGCLAPQSLIDEVCRNHRATLGG
jgi:hypothetical protein